MKVIASIRKDAREMLLNLEKIVKQKTKDASLDLFIEKDRFGRTKFILQEKVKSEGELDEKIMEYLNAEPIAKKKLLQEIKKKDSTIKVKEIKESVFTELVEEIQTCFSEATFSSSGNVIKNVAILNRISKNNRIYSDKALDDIVDLANEGIKSYADHEIENSRGKVRSVRDLIGRIFSAKKTDGKVVGSLEVLENHRSWVFAIAEMPELAGMSIRAMGKIKAERDEKGREVVESVSVLKSIDLVSEPATTKSLFENR